MLKRLIASLICFIFSFSNLQYVHAQDFSIDQLPVPGTMVGASAPFVPLSLKGLVINPQKPLEFQFIVDTGKGPKDTASIKEEANRLVKYFLAGLTIPEGELWVNLSPYEKDRITTASLGQTELGRDLLAQDYILKQLTASLIYPEKDLGKKFWSRVYAKAQAEFGTTNIPVNTFNKVWILPDQAQVYENGTGAYVTKSTLKVMLDEDYLAKQKHQVSVRNDVGAVGANIVRQIVIPEITKEVNTGKNFAPLRQIYDAMILAKWYKETFVNGILDAVYTNKNKTAGVDLTDPTVKEQIYHRYLQAYKKGVFNYIKEEPFHPKKYFSGGLIWTMDLKRDGAMTAIKNAGELLKINVDLEKSKDAAMTADAIQFFKVLGFDNLPADTDIDKLFLQYLYKKYPDFHAIWSMLVEVAGIPEKILSLSEILKAGTQNSILKLLGFHEVHKKTVLSGKTVLLVDSNKDFRKMVKISLNFMGVKKVFEASDGADALKILNKSSKEIDLILMSSYMRGMNGEALLRKMQELSIKVPAVIWSATPSVVIKIKPIPGKIVVGNKMDGIASLLGPVEQLFAEAKKIKSSDAAMVLKGQEVAVLDKMRISALGMPGIGDLSKFPSAEKLSELRKYQEHQGVRVLIVRATIVDQEMIDALPDLKLIIRVGHGMDNIKALEYAKSKGIDIKRTLGSQEPVSALAMRMMARAAMSHLNAKEDSAPDDIFGTISEFQKALEKKIANRPVGSEELLHKVTDLFHPIGKDTIDALKHQTIGIIGYGVIGQEIASAAKQLGMKVLVNSTSLQHNPASLAGTGYSYATKEEIYRSANYVMLITGLYEEGPKANVGMINADVVNMLKENKGLRGLINPDREGLVNEAAVVDLIISRPDVSYIGDEVPQNEILREKAIYTDHIGAFTSRGDREVLGNAAWILKQAQEASRVNGRLTKETVLSGKTILLVDDDEFIRTQARSIFRLLGAKEVVQASDGDEALEMLKAAPHKFDLVVTDFQMPGMDGDMLLREMQELKIRVPAVIWSSEPETIRKRGVKPVPGEIAIGDKIEDTDKLLPLIEGLFADKKDQAMLASSPILRKFATAVFASLLLSVTKGAFAQTPGNVGAKANTYFSPSLVKARIDTIMAKIKGSDDAIFDNPIARQFERIKGDWEMKEFLNNHFNDDLDGLVSSKGIAVFDEEMKAVVRMGKQAVPVLVSYLKDQDRSVRKFSAEALIYISDTSVVNDLKKLGKTDPELAIRVVANRGVFTLTKPEESVPFGLEILRGNDSFMVKMFTLILMGKTGGGMAVDAFSKELKGDNDDMWLFATLGLELSDSNAVVSFISKALDDADPRIRAAAIIIASETNTRKFPFNGKKGLKALKTMLKSKNKDIRALCLVAVAVYSPESAKEIIEKFRDDPSPYVSEMADQLLEFLSEPDHAMLNQAAPPTLKDKASSLKYGGIDLNQIAIKRSGKAIKMRFDAAQLNELMQDGFEGFTPVITRITPLSNPFQALGINSAN